MQIERVPLAQLTPSLFHERYQSASRPVIITEALDVKPGGGPWRAGRFAALLGDTQLNCRVHGSDGHATAPPQFLLSALFILVFCNAVGGETGKFFGRLTGRRV